MNIKIAIIRLNSETRIIGKQWQFFLVKERMKEMLKRLIDIAKKCIKKRKDIQNFKDMQC